jgi:hypothetical protein
MIIATVTALTILFAGGASFSFEKAFKPFVKDGIEDKARQEQILDVAKQADNGLKQFNEEVRKVWAKDLKKILVDYDASEEDMHDFIRRADGSRLVMQQELLKLRFKVVELMTEDEWNAMYDEINKKREEERQKREEKEKKKSG